MSRGKYIVLEGAEGVGKTTMARLVVHELERLGLDAISMHEPDGQADPTTREIRRITQDPDFPMNTKTEVLLYNAARSQSLEAVRAARESGKVVVVDRSYLTTLAVQFYGRGDIADYHKLNDIIDFAVGDMWPDLTVVLDAPVDLLQSRTQKRGETERYDTLGAEMLERIRAGYLWEANQRDMPIVYANGRVDEVFEDVWRHVASLLKLENEAVSEPTALAELLAKSPAAKVLESKKKSMAPGPSSYYVPQTLPDDVQCDYCDSVESMVRARQKLVDELAAHLQVTDTSHVDTPPAKNRAETLLAGLMPVACADQALLKLIARQEPIALSAETLRSLPRGYDENNAALRLVAVQPRNELDLLPEMVYETLDLSLNEVKSTVENWPYAVKSQLFTDYVRQFPDAKVLQRFSYTLEMLTPLSDIASLSPEALQTVSLQRLTPRHGYTTPPEVEAAGLSDDYDAIFDTSLELQSMLQANGFATESQYATLLGHKARWIFTATASDATKFSGTLKKALTLLKEAHPLLYGNH